MIPITKASSQTNKYINENIVLDTTWSNVPQYDTLQGDFYYENLVRGYIDGDAIVKTGGYIECNNDIPKSYHTLIHIAVYTIKNIT